MIGGLFGLPRRLSPRAQLEDFLVLDVPPGPNRRAQELIKAVRVTAVYHVHLLVVHGQLAAGAAAQEALWQATREAVKGSSEASTAYDAFMSAGVSFPHTTT